MSNCLSDRSIFFYNNWQTRRKTKQGPDVPANHIHSIIVGDLRNQTCICGNVIYHVFFYTLNACSLREKKPTTTTNGLCETLLSKHKSFTLKAKKNNRFQVTIKLTKKHTHEMCWKKTENNLKSRNNDTTENTLFASFFQSKFNESELVEQRY